MTPAVLGKVGGVPFLVSEAVLARIEAAGGELEVAQVIAGTIGRAIAEGNGPEIGEARSYDVAGVTVSAAIYTVATGPSALLGVLTVSLPDESGPWHVVRALGEAPQGSGGMLQ